MKHVLQRLLRSLFAWLPATTEPASISYGTAHDGWLQHGVSLPLRGKNFVPCSYLLNIAGRNYVHSTVRDIVLDAYRTMETVRPGYCFKYGETGWPTGGKIKPHKSHRNGTSVDFSVPVTSASGKPAMLPTHLFNHFGYNIDIDASYSYRGYRIDFETAAEHLVALHQAALARDMDIAQVIFDFDMQAELLKTSRGAYIREHIRFKKEASSVRHDDHYHVDFVIPCRQP